MPQWNFDHEFSRELFKDVHMIDLLIFSSDYFWLLRLEGHVKDPVISICQGTQKQPQNVKAS